MAVGEGERLWSLYGFQRPDDLVLEDLALARKILVTDGPLDGMEARLIRKGSRGLIRVKESIPEPGRRRFAIAHELGHWELYKAKSQVFACTAEDMIASYKTSVEEAEANFFASGLLMPSGPFAQRRGDGLLSTEMVSDLAAYFVTSFTATAIRYVDMSTEACAVVISSDGHIRWWRGSRDFEDRFWLDAKSKLSANTVAGSVFAGGRQPQGPEEVDIAAWSDRGADDAEEGTFLEECLIVDRYHQIISLLRML
jgi:hypothetical protein